MGTTNAGMRDPLAILEAALKGGITCFQLREKGNGALSGSEKKAFAKKCFSLCKEFDVPFIINDDVELALEIGADGIHVGQTDAAADLVRPLIGQDKILGVSVASLEEAQIAMEASADYVGMGPVYQTVSKEDARKPAGTEAIRTVHRAFPELPIVAIGGLTAANLEPAILAGASGASVISAIAGAENPFSAATGVRHAAENALYVRR